MNLTDIEDVVQKLHH